MSKLIIIRGLPGSGKSTLAHSAEQFIGCCAVEADNFHIIDNKYVYRPERARYAHEWCQSQAAFYLNQGKNVVVSNTSLTARAMNPYYELALDFGADFEIVNCTGNYDNIHDVPQDILDSMKEKWENFTTESYIEHYNRVYSIFEYDAGLSL